MGHGAQGVCERFPHGVSGEVHEGRGVGCVICVKDNFSLTGEGEQAEGHRVTGESSVSVGHRSRQVAIVSQLTVKRVPRELS